MRYPDLAGLDYTTIPDFIIWNAIFVALPAGTGVSPVGADEITVRRVEKV